MASPVSRVWRAKLPSKPLPLLGLAESFFYSLLLLITSLSYGMGW